MALRAVLMLLILSTAQGFGSLPASRPCELRRGRSRLRMHLFDPQLPFQLLVCAGMLGTGSRIRSSELLKAQANASLEPDGTGNAAAQKVVDVFRETPLRYVGYANECGEAFRPLVPVWVVVSSYVVAILYVLADAGSKALAEAGARSPSAGISSKTVAIAVDALVFQLLASVVCPGYTINRWVALVSGIVAYAEESGSLTRLALDDATLQLVVDWAPTFAGLALIPLIVHPLDALVDALLDNTLRPAIANAVDS
mmetsp:Transcript_589/g.2157  ORF Transcript_589/g.2157 Transcript_589/m.2157 type:complete len:255 (-) Transcript_589:1090-1854(-)